MLSASDLIEEASKIKVNENENPADFFEEIPDILNQSSKIQGYSITKSKLLSKFKMVDQKMYKAGIKRVQISKGIIITVGGL